MLAPMARAFGLTRGKAVFKSAGRLLLACRHCGEVIWHGARHVRRKRGDIGGIAPGCDGSTPALNCSAIA